MIRVKYNQGMTVVEMMISVAILSILMVASLQILRASQRVHAHSIVQDIIRTDADKALMRMIQEFEDITKNAIVSGDEASTATGDALQMDVGEGVDSDGFIRYRRVLGINSSGEQMLSDEHYALVLVPQEDASPADGTDGVDNNNNGVIDEKKLILKRYSDGYSFPTVQPLEFNVDGTRKAPSGNNNGKNVANGGGEIIAEIIHNVVPFDPDEDGPLPSEPLFKVEENALKTLWKIQINLGIQKYDPAGQTTTAAGGGSRATTKVQYKTTTIALK